MPNIRVLITDDHAILREGLSSLLTIEGDIEVVGQASDGREAVNKVSELAPDVVLMDIALPLMDGLDATRRILRKEPETKVIILTQYLTREHILSSIKAGAAGCVPKEALASELVSAIRAVHQGDFYLHPSVTKVVIKEYLQQAQGDSYDHLTDREREVLKLAAEGRTNREIAALLGTTVKTVLGHRTKLRQKLDIHNSAELIKYAIGKRLVSADV